MSAEVIVKASFDSTLVKSGVDQMTSTIKGAEHHIRSSIASMFAAGTVIGFAEHLLKAAENVEHLSEKFGVSVVALQQWQNAAELTGTSTEAIAAGLNKLEIARSKALGGNEGLTKSFEQLGVSLEDLEKLPADAILRKIADGSLNAADMVKVLGRGALELRPLLEGVANGSVTLGRALDEGAIKSLASAERSLKGMEQTLTVFFGSTLGALVSDWQQGWNSIVAIIFASKELIVGYIAAIQKGLHFDFSGAINAARQGGANAEAQIRTGLATNADIAHGGGEGGAAEHRGIGAAGGDAGETDDFGNPTAGSRSRGGSGGGSAESLQTRLATLQKEHLQNLEKQKPLQDQLNALTKTRVDLLNNSAKTNVTEEGTLATNLKLAENQLEVDKVRKQLADERAKAEKDRTDAEVKAREAAAADAET
jgi:hypothetical protein